MRKFLFYSPMDQLSGIHLKKDMFEIPRGFNNNGFKSIIVSGRFLLPPEEGIKFLETNNVHRNSFFICLELVKLIKIIISEEPDVIMFFHNNPYVPIIVTSASLLRKKDLSKGRRTIWIIKSDWDGTRKINETRTGRLMRNLFFSFNSLFVDYITSETTCGIKVLSRYVKREKLLLFPNSFSSRFLEIRGYEETPRKPIILTVARIARQKGLHILLEAFNSLKDEFKEWNIHMVGPVEDKNYYRELLDYIQANNLSSRVQFYFLLGEAALKEEYRSASFFCLPSVYESFQITRMEAAASGLPVITSDAGCGHDFEMIGMKIFKNGDLNGLTLLLKQLMSNEGLRKEISKVQQSNIKSFQEVVSEFIRTLNL